MPFSIQFLDEPVLYPFDDAKTPGAPGLLVMGESKEGFCSSLYEWSKAGGPLLEADYNVLIID
jgi:hypothetical protein